MIKAMNTIFVTMESREMSCKLVSENTIGCCTVCDQAKALESISTYKSTLETKRLTLFLMPYSSSTLSICLAMYSPVCESVQLKAAISLLYRLQNNGLLNVV